MSNETHCLGYNKLIPFDFKYDFTFFFDTVNCLFNV